MKFWKRKKKQEKINNENIKIDFLEYDKQRKEEMLKQNHIELNIIINQNDMPYVQIRNNKISDWEIAKLLVSMELAKEDLCNRCPSAVLKASLIKSKIETFKWNAPIKGDEDNAKRKL